MNLVIRAMLVGSAALLLSGCGGISLASLNPFNQTAASNSLVETVDRLELSADAREDYARQYRVDPSNKAFAISPSGAYGVAFGAASASAAEQGALEKCAADLRRGDLECTLYDVNGRLAYRTPIQLRRVQ